VTMRQPHQEDQISFRPVRVLPGPRARWYKELTRAGWPLLRAAFPAIAVATLIPLALFYLTLAAGSMVWAIGVSVVYAYGFAAFQYGRRRRISGMLLMTVFMVTIRAVSAAASGEAFVYFAIPVVETAGFALMFVATLWTSEPLIVRLVRDLVPHVAEDLSSRRTLIRGLSVIWMITYLASGATTFALLTTVPLPVYMGAHQIIGWCWVGGGLALSFSLCRRRDAGLLRAALAGPPGALARPIAGVVGLPAGVVGLPAGVVGLPAGVAGSPVELVAA
jgi:hypothetical protein